MSEPLFLTVRQASEKSGFSADRIYQLIHESKIRVFKHKTRIKISSRTLDEDLHALVEFEKQGGLNG